MWLQRHYLTRQQPSCQPKQCLWLVPLARQVRRVGQRPSSGNQRALQIWVPQNPALTYPALLLLQLVLLPRPLPSLKPEREASSKSEIRKGGDPKSKSTPALAFTEPGARVSSSRIIPTNTFTQTSSKSETRKGGDPKSKSTPALAFTESGTHVSTSRIIPANTFTQTSSKSEIRKGGDPKSKSTPAVAFTESGTHASNSRIIPTNTFTQTSSNSEPRKGGDPKSKSTPTLASTEYGAPVSNSVIIPTCTFTLASSNSEIREGGDPRYITKIPILSSPLCHGNIDLNASLTTAHSPSITLTEPQPLLSNTLPILSSKVACAPVLVQSQISSAAPNPRKPKAAVKSMAVKGSVKWVARLPAKYEARIFVL
ncbi:hypothetical protein EV426DRAFT_341859 [Tirmania nivea]|nr:hypothetical protein EV426DRAFT_341859 [Tirmania nivea]